MPVITTSNTADRFTYKLFSAHEIRKAWDTFGSLNRKDIEGDKHFVVCRADTETEALVLAALIMRKTDLAPSATYYDPKLGKLYICCEYVLDIEDKVDMCELVIKTFMGMDGLADLDHCWRGEPILYTPGTDAEAFYKERNFPHGAAQKDYGGIKNLHTRIPAEFAGVI